MQSPLYKLLGPALPLIVAGLLAGFASGRYFEVDEDSGLATLEVASAADLSAEFERLGYRWPPGEGVPALALVTLPVDLDQMADVGRKKQLFFQALLPIVMAENRVVARLRHHVTRLLDEGLADVSSAERNWLETIAVRYGVRGDLAQEKNRRRLLRRLDVVPLELALAQAANESAWGTSRFVQLGNNLFGHWTYRESEGIVPLRRPEGERYAVRTFDSLEESVQAYVHNLNTHSAYRGFRRLRERMREAGEPLDAQRLAGEMQAYSARGEDYVGELREMMRHNRLEALDGIALLPAP